MQLVLPSRSLISLLNCLLNKKSEKVRHLRLLRLPFRFLRIDGRWTTGKRPVQALFVAFLHMNKVYKDAVCTFSILLWACISWRAKKSDHIQELKLLKTWPSSITVSRPDVKRLIAYSLFIFTE